MAASVLLTLRGSNSYWMESLTKMTTSFNSSFLLGLVAFSQTEPMREDYLELAMNLVLLASLVLYLTGVATVGSMVTPAAPVVMESHELFGLAGLSSAILMAASQHVFGLICSVAFLGIVIFSFHRKNLVIILAIPLYVILNMKVILGGADLINRESLAVLSLTLICQPLVNIFTSSVSTLDAWKPVLGKVWPSFVLTQSLLCYRRACEYSCLCIHSDLYSCSRAYRCINDRVTACKHAIVNVENTYTYVNSIWLFWKHVLHAVVQTVARTRLYIQAYVQACILAYSHIYICRHFIVFCVFIKRRSVPLVLAKWWFTIL